MAASRQLAIGIFLVGGLLLFGFGIFWIGDRRQLFTASTELYAEFKNLSGIAKGAKVRVSGLDAGEILEIQLPSNPDSRFRLRFRVLSQFQPILRTDSIASIQNDGLVGNKFLQIDAGTSAAMPITAGATIPSREPIEIADVIARVNETVMNANQAVLDIQDRVDDTVKTILEVAKETTEAINDVSTQVTEFAGSTNAITKDVRTMVANARAGQGTVGQLLTDDKLYQQLRMAVDEGQQVAQNFKEVSDDLKEISEDLKSRDLGAKVDRVAANMETLTNEAAMTIRSFREPQGESGGLMADIRQTLSSANETMANFADNSEALKRNFFFRGFFNDRGFFDLDAVTVEEYQTGKFLPDRQKISAWLDATDLFASTPAGKEQITEMGRTKLDMAMAGFLQYSKTEPFVVEAWAGPGSEPERVLQSRERAIMVSDYLIKKFDLKPNYVAVMPMNAAPVAGAQARDGVGLALFIPKRSRK